MILWVNLLAIRGVNLTELEMATWPYDLQRTRIQSRSMSQAKNGKLYHQIEGKLVTSALCLQCDLGQKSLYLSHILKWSLISASKKLAMVFMVFW